MSEQLHSTLEATQRITLEEVHAEMSLRLIPFLKKKGFSEQDAEDASQEAYARLVKHWPAMSAYSVKEIHQWLYTVARNAGVSAWRKHKPVPFADVSGWTLETWEKTRQTSEELKNEQRTGEEIEEERQQFSMATAYILRAFDYLPEEKTALLQGVLSGKKQRAMAEQTGLHESVVSRKLRSIYADMRAGLEEEGITEEVLQFNAM